MARKKWPKLVKGDLIAIHWIDIVSDAIGDIDKADTAYCVTLGHFHEWKGRGRNRMLVTGLTVFPKEADEEPRGWDTYPVGCIAELKKLAEVSDD